MRARRQYRRFIRRLEVEFSSSDQHYRGISSNFSIGGLFVRTNHPFAPGSLVDLTVHLPDGGTAALKGRVKMALKTPAISLRNGMGIEILERDSVFVNFVRSLSKEQPMTEEEGTPGVSRDEGGRFCNSMPGPDTRDDFFIIRCSNCAVRNKVRKASASQSLVCGKCGALLTPPA